MQNDLDQALTLQKEEKAQTQTLLKAAALGHGVEPAPSFKNSVTQAEAAALEEKQAHGAAATHAQRANEREATPSTAAISA